jgi:hypothetical protein
MRLIDLEPQWVVSAFRDAQGVVWPSQSEPVNARHGMGVMFRCPVHYPTDCDFAYLYIPFSNPVDGGPPPLEGQGRARAHFWQREGDTFETLTLRPSIKFPEDGPEHWHGFITNGGIH